MKEIFQNPAATSTVIVEREGKVLFIRRKDAPYQGMLALPGGFLNYGQETLEGTAQRELYEETGLKVGQEELYLLCVNSSPTRDPRDHVIDHVYVALKTEGKPKANDDAASLEWKTLEAIPEQLAFDHGKVIKDYLGWRKTQ